MGVAHLLKARLQRFLERPGTTVDLRPLRAKLPAVAARGEKLTSVDDVELTRLAGEAEDLVEICAVGREAAHRALAERPYDVQVLGILALLDGHVAEMATAPGTRDLGTDHSIRSVCLDLDALIVDHPTRTGEFINVSGGWADAADYLQYVTTSATATSGARAGSRCAVAASSSWPSSSSRCGARGTS